MQSVEVLGGLGAENTSDVIDEVLEGIEFLLDELRCTEAGVVGGFPQLLQPVLMHTPLLAVVGHALQVALVLHFLHDLIDVALDVHTHTPDLLQRLRHLSRLDLADLTVSLRFLLQELQVFIADVGDVVQHFRVEVANRLFFLLVVGLHGLYRLSLRKVVLL